MDKNKVGFKKLRRALTDLPHNKDTFDVFYIKGTNSDNTQRYFKTTLT